MTPARLPHLAALDVVLEAGPLAAESQSPGPAESDGALGREDPYELPCHRIIFTHARHRVRSTERPFALLSFPGCCVRGLLRVQRQMKLGL